MKGAPAVFRRSAGKHCRKDKLPVGTVVIRKKCSSSKPHRARYIKVRDDGPKGRRWIMYSRWWWENNNGPVPPGKLVIHKDGNPLNDKPENLVLGTPGTKLAIVHRDEAWSKAQHEVAGKATGEHNRFRGKLNRLTGYLEGYWYPVMDSYEVILNVPFRRRKPLVGWFGTDVSNYPMNGRAKRHLQKTAYDLGIRPVRGRDLGQEHYRPYIKIDPGFEVGAGTRAKVAEKLEMIQHLPVWKRAQEAALLDLRDRD